MQELIDAHEEWLSLNPLVISSVLEGEGFKAVFYMGKLVDYSVK